jgi:hypothetical protein
MTAFVQTTSHHGSAHRERPTAVERNLLFRSAGEKSLQKSHHSTSIITSNIDKAIIAYEWLA